MIYKIGDLHREHLKKMGVTDIPSKVEIPEEEYQEDYGTWKRTLPGASHEVIHTKVLGHHLWKRHSAAQIEKTQVIEHVHKHEHVLPKKQIGVIILIILFLFLLPKLHCQFSYPIQTKNGGSPIGFHKSFFIINCSTNTSCTDDGTTLLVTASSSAGSRWDQLTNPSGNLSLSMTHFTTTWVYDATTGSNANLFVITDTTNNTGTGHLLLVNTTSGSAAKPVGFFALGTSNGVEMSATGVLAKVGTGSVNADQCNGATCGTVTSVATTAPITGGAITATGTIACATCATTTNGGALSATAPVTISAAGVIAATSHGGTARVQLSDNTGTSGNYAKYAANGDVTDGGGVAVITTRSIATTAPITGGGDLSADRTIALTSHGGTARAQLSDNTGTSGNGAKFAANGDLTDGGFVAANVVTASAAAGAGKQTCISNSTDKTCVYIDFPDAKYFPAAICVNAVAAQAWSAGATPAATCRAGTNNKDAFLGPFGASDVAYFKIHLPKDWDTATNPSLMLDVASTDATNGHTVIMQESVACAKLDGSTTDDVAFNAARSLSTVTLNGNANRTWEADLALNGTDMTGCSAPGIMWVKVSRTTDTATNVEVYGAMLTIPRLLTVQAN